MRGLFTESFRVAGEYRHTDAQIQFVMRPQQAFQEPGPHESGAAGDEYGMSAYLLPQLSGVAKDVVQILWRQTWHASEIHAEIGLDLAGYIIQHLFAEARMNADPEGIVHDPVG